VPLTVLSNIRIRSIRMLYRVFYAFGVLYLHLFSPVVAGIHRVEPQLKPKTHYEVLELGRDCTGTQIKKAYRQLALELHPDKVRMSVRYAGLDTEMAKALFLDVQNAYSVLAVPGTAVQRIFSVA